MIKDSSADKGSEAPLPVVKPNVEQAVEAVRLFQELKGKLLGAEDVVEIGGKRHIKRSGWRKVALAFNVSTAIVDVQREKWEDRTVIRVRVRATAPGGRFAEEVGVCETRELLQQHMDATDHNIETKAATRAINRAVSDLVGGGEVSADELMPVPAEKAQGTEPKTAGWPTLDVPDVEARLEALLWTPAQSGRCDFVQDPPADLLAAVRADKGGLKGERHHFTAHATDAVLFRYERRGSK